VAAPTCPHPTPVGRSELGNVSGTVQPAPYRSYVKTYTMRDGQTRLKFNGFQAATVQGNGKTLHFNISGPGTVFINGDMLALVGTGHGIYIGPPGTTQPGLRLYTGKVEYAVEPSGNAIVTSYTGRVTDICTLLR